MNIQKPVPGQTPRRIRIDPRDNVAVVVNALGLPAGTVFDDGLTLNQIVPQGHKLALADIAEGGEIVRYGQVIGTAAAAIARGDWVDETKVALRPAPALETLTYAPTPRPAPEPLAGYTFEGYRNEDGTVGTKNI